MTDEKIMVLIVSACDYNFDDERGVNHQGISYKVFLAHFKDGAKYPYYVEICKSTKEEAEHAYENIGKIFNGSVLYDRYGRFCGISG